MRKAVSYFKKRYQKKQTFFFDEQQAVNQDDNITPDEDEPMDVDAKSEMLQASNILAKFYANYVILEGELSLLGK